MVVLTSVLAIADWVSRTRCGMTGHTMLRHFESRRVWLECLDCGEESDGWTISQARVLAEARGGVHTPPLRPALSAWSR